MYHGRRDPEIRIVVEKEHCSSYTDQNSKRWVEIFIPTESIADYPTQWGSLMIDPKQVDSLGKDSPYNVIRVNDGAQITVSVKDKNRNVTYSEILTPDQIIGRWLKYYRAKTYANDLDYPVTGDDVTSYAMYEDMEHMGQNMLFYMNRLPKTI